MGIWRVVPRVNEAGHRFQKQSRPPREGKGYIAVPACEGSLAEAKRAGLQSKQLIYRFTDSNRGTFSQTVWLIGL
eukprot:1147992-Pelagomonas_calceolata.AAC.1